MIYLDNAAAMKINPAVIDYFNSIAPNCSANQEAIHGAGLKIRKDLENSSSEALKLLMHNSKSVPKGHFCSSGTECFNLLFGSLDLKENQNIVTTQLEHPALLAAIGRQNRTVRHLKLERGVITAENLAAVLDAQTAIVAVHHVQSELGLIQDVKMIGQTVRRLAPQALILIDTIQSAGKLALDDFENVDFLTVSGHKIGAFGGAILVVNRPAAVKALEVKLKNYRTVSYLIGRPEPLQMFCCAYALKCCCENLQENLEQVRTINAYCRQKLSQLALPNGEKLIISLPENHSSMYILHFILPGYQSAVLLRMLSSHHIYVSASSACQAENPKPSRAIIALDISEKSAFSGLRLSFNPTNTVEEIDEFIETLTECLRNY